MYIARNAVTHGNQTTGTVINTTPVRAEGAIQVSLTLLATNANTLSAVQLQVSDKDSPDVATAGDWLDAGSGQSMTTTGTVAATAMNGNGGGIVQVAGSSSSNCPLIAWRWVRWKLTVGASTVNGLAHTTKAVYSRKPASLNGTVSGLFLS